jgi:hypothetical protein
MISLLLLEAWNHTLSSQVRHTFLSHEWGSSHVCSRAEYMEEVVRGSEMKWALPGLMMPQSLPLYIGLTHSPIRDIRTMPAAIYRDI